MAVTFVKKGKKVDSSGEQMSKGPYYSVDDPFVYAEFQQTYANPHDKVKAIKHVRSLCHCSLKEAKDLVEEWIEQLENHGSSGGSEFAKPFKDTYTTTASTYDPDPDIGTPVPLTEATQLHQPVLGTSTGSCYHTVAFNEHIKVAVRILPDYDIAVRAICTEHINSTIGKNVKKKMLAAGLNKKPAGHYSIHLEPGNLPMARKTLGALLFAIGGNFHSISDRIEELVGVGK